MARDKTLTIEIDWGEPTPIPSPAFGNEYELRAEGGDVHVNQGLYGEQPLFRGRKTVIRSSGAVVTADKPGVKVVASPERPDQLLEQAA